MVGPIQANQGDGQSGVFLPAAGLRGRVRVPGDKSISHRALLLGAVNGGAVRVTGLLRSADTLATLRAVQRLGVEVEEIGPAKEEVIVHGRGWEGLREPEDVIDVANAGTLIRVLPGILAACPFYTVLTGDASIRQRPMVRILEPLGRMGARVDGRACNRFPPFSLHGGMLTGIVHRMDVASAQVKSCLILAGLRAKGITQIYEPGPSRDHTERLLRVGGARISRAGDPLGPGVTWVQPLEGDLNLRTLAVPGDFSSAAFLLVAALLVPDSEIAIERVGLNPTRTGLLDVLREMGADVVVETSPDGGEGEPLGTIRARTSRLSACDIDGRIVPLLIDELPIWTLAAARAEGISRLRGAKELRVKESDRLAATAALLRTLGVEVKEHEDGLDILGRPQPWEGGEVSSGGDHRLAMVGAVAGLASCRGVRVDDVDCIRVSYPEFIRTIDALRTGAPE